MGMPVVGQPFFWSASRTPNMAGACRRNLTGEPSPSRNSLRLRSHCGLIPGVSFADSILLAARALARKTPTLR